MKSLRLLFILAAFLVFVKPAASQNLFPNGGFEQYDQCPTYSSQINRCTGWDSCIGTADFYHCSYYGWSTIGSYGIPATGNGVAGLICAVPGSWTQPPGKFYGETFRAPLARTLEVGATYKIQADILYNMVQPEPPGDCFDVGFYFFKSDNPPFYPAGMLGHNQYKPMVSVAANLVPVMSYGTFTFNYTPDSCYDQVMIGLFSNNNTFGTLCYLDAGSFYLDIDNVSMIQTAPAPVRTFTYVSDRQNICIDDCINFNGNSNLPVYTWDWNFNGAATGQSTMQNPENICYPATGSYDVELIATYECDADTFLLENYIHVKDVPHVSIITDTTISCFGNDIILTAESNELVTWNNGSQTAQITAENSGSYIATSINECGTDADTIDLKFENCPCTVYLPNAFTPDEDGKNDIFKAEGDCLLEEFQLEIYDRWGKRIFTASDIQTSWDGKSDGLLCPNGVYAYNMTYKGYADYRLKKVHKSGWLVLLK